MNKKNLILILAIIALAVASRLVKHPPNFTPVVAMSIFAGYYLNKKWGWLLPMVAMFLSDAFIGFYDWRLMAVVYLSIGLSFVLGYGFKRFGNWRSVLACSLTASVLFFILTNFAVWALYQWYPHTWAGLLNCFVMALPFFKNTLAGDLVYSVALFGTYEFAWFYVNQKQTKLMKI